MLARFVGGSCKSVNLIVIFSAVVVNRQQKAISVTTPMLAHSASLNRLNKDREENRMKIKLFNTAGLSKLYVYSSLHIHT